MQLVRSSLGWGVVAVCSALVWGCGSEDEPATAAPPAPFGVPGNGQPPAPQSPGEQPSEPSAPSTTNSSSSEQMQNLPLSPAPQPMAAGGAGNTPTEMPPVEMPPVEMPPVEMPPAPNTTPRVPFQLTGIIGTGQSLSVGAQSPNPT